MLPAIHVIDDKTNEKVFPRTNVVPLFADRGLGEVDFNESTKNSSHTVLSLKMTEQEI